MQQDLILKLVRIKMTTIAEMIQKEVQVKAVADARMLSSLSEFQACAMENNGAGMNSAREKIHALQDIILDSSATLYHLILKNS